MSTLSDLKSAVRDLQELGNEFRKMESTLASTSSARLLEGVSGTETEKVQIQG